MTRLEQAQARHDAAWAHFDRVSACSFARKSVIAAAQVEIVRSEEAIDEALREATGTAPARDRARAGARAPGSVVKESAMFVSKIVERHRQMGLMRLAEGEVFEMMAEALKSKERDHPIAQINFCACYAEIWYRRRVPGFLSRDQAFETTAREWNAERVRAA